MGSCLAVAVEVGVRGFGLQVLQRARFAYTRESGAEGDAFASAYLIVVEAEDDAISDGLAFLPRVKGVWDGCALDAGGRARELRGEVDLLIASPAVGVAEACDLCGRDGFSIAMDEAVPVHRLVQIEDDADRVGILLEGVALYPHAVGGGQLDTDLIGLECHGIVAGLRHLGSVREACVDADRCLLLSRLTCLRLAGEAVVQRGKGDGEEGDIIEVACSRATQVRVAEACDRAVGVEVASDIVPARTSVVGAELHHAEWGRGARVDIAHPVGTDERIHALREVWILSANDLLALCG